MSLFWGWVERTELSDDFGDALANAAEKPPFGAVVEGAAEHLEDMRGGIEGMEQAGQVGARRGSRESAWRGDKMGRIGERLSILVLQVLQGDLEILHGHFGVVVPE